MDDQFGDDQNGQRDQETNVRLDVVKERDLNGAVQRMATDHRQQQQRQPRNSRDHHDPPPEQLQRISGQMCPSVQLKQWTTEHQRKVGMLIQNCGLGHGNAPCL